MSGYISFGCGAVLLMPAAVVLAADPPLPPPLPPPPSAEAPQDETPQPEEPKEATVAVVISALRQEAMDAWREDWTLPREEPDFAAEMNWTLPDEDIVRALTRRLARNPALDGYIKWQLLSFEPDLAALDRATIDRIVAQMPDPLKQPQPKSMRSDEDGGVASISFGRQMSYVRDVDPVVGDGAVAYDPRIGTMTSGVRLGTGGSVGYQRRRATFRWANRRLEEARQRINRANRPIHTYREALLRAVPAELGLRLGLMLKDVRDRLLAGDPTYQEAMDRLLDQAQRPDVHGGITPEDRQTLIRWARALRRMSGPIVRGVGLNRRGKPEYDRDEVTLRERDIELLIEYLRDLPRKR